MPFPWLAAAVLGGSLYGSKRQSDKMGQATSAQQNIAQQQLNMGREMWGAGAPYRSMLGSWTAQEQPLYDQLLGLQKGMLGMGNYAANMPWWMQTPTDTSDIEPALSTLSRMNLADAGRQEAGNVARLYASRGIPMSQEKAGYTPGFQRWFTEARAREGANKALTLADIMAQRRNEAASRFGAITGTLGQRGNQLGQYSTMFTNPALGAYGQAGQTYGNIANMWANQPSMLGNILNLGAQYYGAKAGGMFGGGNKPAAPVTQLGYSPLYNGIRYGTGEGGWI